MKKIPKSEYLLISLLIAVNLAIGIVTLADYGESWDEARLYEYGGQSLNAYRALFNPGIPIDFGNDDLRYYGPAYFMGMTMLVRTAHYLFPDTSIVDLWHLGNFAILQLGLLCFYFLLRRFLDVLPAWTAAALFASQPLIWGHGFINPKDIPFMAFFTASVYFGLRMVDDFGKQDFAFRALVESPWFWAASVSLGLTISIRILGFAAAGIVLFCVAFVNRHKVLRLSYVYFAPALVVSFLTWPYLWSSPVSNFLKGIYAMLKFQWVGKILFNGTYFPASQLPRLYVPQLLSMQLTETTLVLFTVGILTLLVPRLREKYSRLFILSLAWFGFPLLYILINGMNLYDNTRQLLFIFPGLFLVVAIGLDFILGSINPAWARILIVAIAILPGAAGMAAYHPYEYTYYNLVTTSRQEIFRNYETDYWATSFKDVAKYLNENAPEDSQVIVWGPSQLIQHPARQDLVVRSFDDLNDRDYARRPFYLVLTTRYDMDTKFFPNVAPIYSVQHNDSILAVVKYIIPRE